MMGGGSDGKPAGGGKRRSIRLRGFDYSLAGWYYVTTCVWKRECLFGQVRDGGMFVNEAGSEVMRAWDEVHRRFGSVELDASVVMPNHFHGIVVLAGRGEGAASSAPTPTLYVQGTRESRFSRGEVNSGGPTLGEVVRAFKSLSAIAVNRCLGRRRRVWQRGYFEHVIRDEEELRKVRE